MLAQREDQVIYISDDDVSEKVGGLIDLTGINGSPAYKPKVPAVFRAEGNADCLCLVTMLLTLLNTRIVKDGLMHQCLALVQLRCLRLR